MSFGEGRFNKVVRAFIIYNRKLFQWSAVDDWIPTPLNLSKMRQAGGGLYFLCRKHSGPHTLVSQMWKQGCTKSEVFPQLLYFCASTSKMRLRSECKWIKCTPQILLNTELLVAHRSGAGSPGAISSFRARLVLNSNTSQFFWWPSPRGWMAHLCWQLYPYLQNVPEE